MSTNEPMTKEQIDAIASRTAAAERGPWVVLDGGDNETSTFIDGPGGDVLIRDWRGSGYLREEYVWVEKPNAEFIAHAREDIPALLAELERLRDELAKAREVTEEKITEAVYGSMEVNCELRVMENMQTTWCEAHDSEVDAADRCFHVWDIVDPALTTALNGCDDA